MSFDCICVLGVLFRSVWSASPVVLCVCSVRPAACCHSRDHCGEPRTCYSCLNFSCELWPRQLWHSKTCLSGLKSRIFVIFFNLVYHTICSLSRSVWVNQSVRQNGPPQTIESDDIAAPLVLLHSFSRRACREWLPPETQDLNCFRGDLHGSSALRCGSCIVYSVWSVTGPQKMTAVLVGWPTGKNPLAFMQLLQAKQAVPVKGQAKRLVRFVLRVTPFEKVWRAGTNDYLDKN